MLALVLLLFGAFDEGRVDLSRPLLSRPLPSRLSDLDYEMWLNLRGEF